MWVKIDDLMPQHPKLVQAGPLAYALDVAGICYCACYLTDGFIPAGAVPNLLDFTDVVAHGASGADLRKHLVARLVDVGRWIPEANGSGWWVHGYLEYNPSAEDVKAKREADRQRKGWSGRSDPRPASGAGIQADSVRNPGGIRTESTRIPNAPSPSPSPEKSLSSVVSVEEQPEAMLNEDDDENEFSNDEPLNRKVGAGLEALADIDLERRQASGGPPVKDPTAYRRSCLAERKRNDRARLVELARANPTRQGTWLARQLLAEANAIPKPPTPVEYQPEQVERAPMPDKLKRATRRGQEPKE